VNIIGEHIYEGIEDLLPLDLQGWNGDRAVHLDLIDEVRPSLILEVGTWKGQSAIHMGTHLKARGLDAKIICVDAWLGALEFWDHLADTPERNLLLKNGYPQIYFQFLSNVVHSGLQAHILPFPNTSLIAARYFANQGIRAELIYIDASHEYEDVLADLEAYWPLLAPGRLVFDDDYNSYWPGVRKAVREFAKKRHLEVRLREKNFWILRRKRSLWERIRG
jgi:hypothetical protein